MLLFGVIGKLTKNNSLGSYGNTVALSQLLETRTFQSLVQKILHKSNLYLSHSYPNHPIFSHFKTTIPV